MEVEYTWNYFHFHAACTFTGQPSTTEERTLSSDVFSHSWSVIPRLQKHVYTLMRSQVDHLELYICKGYFEGQNVCSSCFVGSVDLGYKTTKVFIYWMSPNAGTNWSRESSYKGRPTERDKYIVFLCQTNLPILTLISDFMIACYVQNVCLVYYQW